MLTFQEGKSNPAKITKEDKRGLLTLTWKTLVLNSSKYGFFKFFFYFYFFQVWVLSKQNRAKGAYIFLRQRLLYPSPLFLMKTKDLGFVFVSCFVCL